MKVFISYRRDDAAGHAGRLADHLAARFGAKEVFIDVASIEAGEDYVEAIEGSITAADVTLVVIGPTWSTATDVRGDRRLWASDDPVRIEVEAALAAGARTIPVLVGGATMPSVGSLPGSARALASLNAVELVDRRWASDVAELLDLLEHRGAGRPVPVSVPASNSSFVGRVDLLREADDALAASRLVVLTGPGGVGKTRLALELATRWAASGRAAWFATLTTVRDPAATGETVLASLGVVARGEEGMDAAVRLLRRHPGLLVVDNCEHVLAAVADLIAELVAGAPDLHVLATSRETLGLEGERVVSLAPLQIPQRGLVVDQAATGEAVALFADRASRSADFAVTAENLSTVIDICERVAGLPLGIELAAARVRSLPLDDIASRLAAHPEILSHGAPRGHHSTLTTAIDWSVDLLPPSERRTFERLAIFEAPFSLEGAEAVGDAGAHDIAQLVDKSLLVMERTDVGTTYRFLEPIRRRAEALLEAGTELGSARDAHSRWIADLAKQAEPRFRGPDQSTWIARIGALLPDVRAALAREASGHPDPRLTIAGSLWWVLVLLDADDWRPVYERLLASVDEDDPDRPQLVSACAVQCLFEMDLTRADELAHVALQRASRASLAGMVASTTIGTVHRERGEFAEALERHRQDEVIAREASLPWWEARARYSAGLVHVKRGDLAPAIEDLEAAHRLALRASDPSQVIDCLLALYEVASQSGDEAAMMSAVDRMSPWIDGAMSEERALATLSRAALELTRGDVASALELATDAVDRSLLFGQAIDVSVIASEVVAACLSRQGRHDEAVRLVAAGESFLPLDKRFYLEMSLFDRERLLVDLRLTMGADAFATAWRAGAGERFEDLLASL